MPTAPPAVRLPLAPVACAVAAGTACGYAASGGVLLAIAAPPLLVVLALAPRARTVLLGCLLGLVLGRASAPAIAHPPELRAGRLPAVHTLEGRLLRVDPAAERTQFLVIGVEAIGLPPAQRPVRVRLPVQVQRRGLGAWSEEALAPGARVRLVARISERHGRLRAFVHDRRAVTLLQPSASAHGAISDLRRRAAWSLSRRFDLRDDGLARALLLGDRGRLDVRDRTLFRRTGQAHLLAVSGLHVGLLLGGLLLLLRLLGATPRILWVAGCLAAAVYVPFTGTQPSAVRAGLGAGTWFLARLAGRRPRGAAILTVAALAVLLTQPTAVGEPSFQLSFAAVTCIVLLGRPLRQRLVRERPVIPGLLPPRRAPLRTALSISTAAWIGTAPFVAEHIGRLCPGGPLLSLAALPLTAVLLASGFAFLILAPWGVLADVAAAAFELAAGLLRTVLTSARALHLDAWDVTRPAVAWWLLYGCMIVLLASERLRGARWPWIVLCGLLVVLFVPLRIPLLSAIPSVGREDGEEYDAPIVSSFACSPAVILPDAAAVVGVGLGLLVFAGIAVRLSWLRTDGAGAAWGLGVTAFLAFGAGGVAALFAPFLVATLLGKMPGHERARARDLRQVLCNGVPAFLGCLLALSGRADLGQAFFLGALACLGSDSCATEIGVRFGGSPMRLVGRGPIAPGESGGVTVAGTLAALGGAALAPAAFLLLGDSEAPARALGLLTAAGLAGSLLDSVLGGWLQFRGRIPDTGGLTEAPWVGGALTERVSGWRWLDNDAVNLVTGFAAGAVAVALAHLA